jgi:hypothetical protein
MNVRRNNLLHLLDKIEWIMLENRNTTKFPSDAVAISFIRSEKTKPVDTVRIRIGPDALKKLDWKKGDKVFISLDKDDLLNFKIVKSTTARGYTVCQEPSSQNCTLTFKWRYGEFKLTEQKWTRINFYVYKSILLLNCNDTWSEPDEALQKDPVRF